MPILKIGRHITAENNKYEELIDLVIKKKLNSIQTFIGGINTLENKKIEKELSHDEIKKIREKIDKNKINLVVHANYLPKLTRNVDNKYKRVLYSIVDEMISCEKIGGKFVVVHTGVLKSKGHEKLSEKEATENIIKSAKWIIKKYNENSKELSEKLKENSKENSKVKLLLETCSGQGTEFPSNIEILCEILLKIDDNSNNIGLCIDTCHIFAAGYKITQKEDVINLFEELNKKLKNKLYDYLKVIHLNDSVEDLGKKRDHHTNIGCGYIYNEQLDGLKYLIEMCKKNNIIVILETPVKGHEYKEINFIKDTNKKIDWC